MFWGVLLKTNSVFLGRLLIIAIVLGDTFTILAALPFTGLFIRMVHCSSLMSLHLILTASAVLAGVSFNVCRNVAIFFPQPAMS
jgi:hypothetical protein